MPSSVPLTSQKPASLKQFINGGEFQYATISIGNGPKRGHLVALEMPKDRSDVRFYADEEGDGHLVLQKWTKKVVDGIADYEGTITFRASYGNSKKESNSAPFALNFYWSQGRASLNYYRASVRTGKIVLGKETYSVRVVENNNDGVFNASFMMGGKHTRPVWLVLDGTMVDLRGTFGLNGFNYIGMISPDGARLTLTPTIRSISEPKIKPVKEPELLKVGVEAPDFEVPLSNGRTFRLSKLRKEVVVLDFWATWCGPCKASLPHLQKVWEQVTGKDVVVLALNVFDDKPAYDSWVAHNSTYSFPIGYDPAGRGATSIAKSLYQVDGIPTTYVIDQDGKVAATIVGFEGPSDHRLEAALAKLGVSIEAPKSIPMTKFGG